MIRNWMSPLAAVVLFGACAAASQDSQVVQQPAGPCVPSARMAVEGRTSPYDSAAAALGGGQVKVCYGRPSARGRTIFGELVAYDTLWRTGANEPTVVHLSVPAEVAGVRLEPGSYSLYTVPGREQWTVVLNRATEQWGHERQYESVRGQEIARAVLPAERAGSFVETFTIDAEPAGAGAAHLVLAWENTRVRIPVRAI